MAQRSV